MALFLGTANVILLYVPLKAFAPTLLSLADFIVIFLRFLHDKNAFAPMLVTLLPIVTFLRAVYLLNAFALTDVILNLTSPITTVSVMVSDANLLSDLEYVVPAIATVPVPSAFAPVIVYLNFPTVYVFPLAAFTMANVFVILPEYAFLPHIVTLALPTALFLL